MRLTATDKAIGEINMRRADLERAKAVIEKYGVDNAMTGIGDELGLMDRCIDMLRSVAPAPKPEKADKPKRVRKSKHLQGQADYLKKAEAAGK